MMGALRARGRPLPFANLGRSGQRLVGRDVEALLGEEWRSDRDR
jgi:hypothetical protein